LFERTYIDPAGILLAGAAQAPAGTVIPGLGTVTDPAAGTIFFDLLPRATFSRFTPRVALELRPREDMLLYASVTNGFKSGGFNLQNNGETFSPENIWSYELGMRADWLGGRLRTNLTGFYYDYKDLQVIRFDGLANNVSNADARIHGIELEMVARPTREITVDGSIAWLDAQYTRYLTLNSNFPGLGEVDLRGNRLPKSPEFTVSAGLEYRLQLGQAGELTLRGEVRYVSDVYFDQFETGALNQDGYALVNARLSFRSADERWSAALFGRNLTDATYYQSMVRVDQFFGTVASFGAPRTYGIELGVRF
jgi:iron complex outermembrane receptor protein